MCWQRGVSARRYYLLKLLIWVHAKSIYMGGNNLREVTALSGFIRASSFLEPKVTGLRAHSLREWEGVEETGGRFPLPNHRPSLGERTQGREGLCPRGPTRRTTAPRLNGASGSMLPIVAAASPSHV